VIGIDSNVLVRLLVADNQEQYQHAYAFFNSLNINNQGYISLIALVETFWVLDRAYKKPKESIIAFLEHLLEAEEIALQDSQAVYFALEAYKNNADFSDALIHSINKSSGCADTVTFDKKAATSLGMRLLSSEQ